MKIRTLCLARSSTDAHCMSNVWCPSPKVRRTALLDNGVSGQSTPEATECDGAGCPATCLTRLRPATGGWTLSFANDARQEGQFGRRSILATHVPFMAINSTAGTTVGQAVSDSNGPPGRHGGHDRHVVKLPNSDLNQVPHDCCIDERCVARSCIDFPIHYARLTSLVTSRFCHYYAPAGREDM